MPTIYGLGEQDIKRLGKALNVVEGLFPPTFKESSSIPKGDRNRYYPFGNSFAFGIVSAPTRDGHLLLISQGFVHSPVDNQPIMIDETRYYVIPYGDEEKYFHVFVRFDTAKLTIVKSASLEEFDDPSYYMTESNITVNGASAVRAEVSSEEEVDWSNVQLLYSVHIKDGSLLKVLRADGALSIKPDTETTGTLPEVRASIEISDDPRCYQVYGFDNDSQVVDGLETLIESDPVTGVITAKLGSESYELLVRVKNSDGTIRVIGYMSIGTPPNPEDPLAGLGICGDDLYPAVADPDGLYTEEDVPYEGDLDPLVSVDEPDDDLNHPAKTNPCW